jgi:hypothetical protein
MSDLPKCMPALGASLLVGPSDQLVGMVSVAVWPLPCPFPYPAQIGSGHRTTIDLSRL